MKKLFIAIAALAAMTSCSQDEVMEVAEKQAISFGNAFVDKSTRAATDPSYVNGTKDIELVKVWGTVNGGKNDVLIFNNANVTKGTAEYNTAWNCDVTQYWIPGSTYKFVGIVDGQKDKVTSLNFDGGLLPVSVNYIADGETDLLCNVQEADNVTTGYNELVKFEYNHLLSKVKFTLTDESPADNGVKTHFRYSVSNIKITNAYAQGTVDVATGSWGSTLTATKAEGQTDNYCTFGDITWEDTDKECAAEKLLLPGIKPEVSFTLTLEAKKAGTTDTWETVSVTTPAPTANVTLEAAKAYNFNIQVGVGNQIKFTVTECPSWTTVPAIYI